jgi:quercetin dioxygenase-like cupin family protein
MKLAALLFSSALLCAQRVNLATAKWVREKNGSDSVTLREDATATEYLVRYPAGHVFAPHWHSVNERIVLIEGRLSLRQGAGPELFLDAGGYAFLPAKEVQRTKCVSTTPCSFYVHWDGKLDFHPE